MKIQHVSAKATKVAADIITLCHFTDQHDAVFKDLDEVTKGRLSERLKEERFTGKDGQMIVIDTRDLLPTTWVAVFGAGEHKSFSPRKARDLAAKTVKAAMARRAKKVAFVLPSHRCLPAEVHFSAMGAELGTYSFDKYKKSGDDKKHKIRSFDIVVDARGKKVKSDDGKLFDREIEAAQAIASSVCQARDLVNEPAAYMTPTQLAKVAMGLAKKHTSLKVKVLDAKECDKLGMGMYLAVGRGSSEPPKFIHMTYTPKGKSRKGKRVALIGKGVMFDSGGYSIKPSSAMEDMKIDMAGAAAVISAMDAIATLELHHEVHAVAACCENLVSGNAYKLGDVLHSMDGTTVEINNTDAEGRLTLGDAITYTRDKIKPDEMFDFATLTGACMVALGPNTAGVFSRNDELAAGWLAAAERAGENMWRLPLEDDLKGQLKSSIADLRNTGDRWGGAITAALFLEHFAKDSRWLHVDLAGPASSSKEQGAIAKGGTGFAVATIVDYLRS